MRRIGGFCFAVASLVATPAAVNAQVCMGTASFADSHLRAQVGTSSVADWRYYQVGLTLGRERGAFVEGGVSRGTYKYSDVTDNGLGASVGYQVPLGTRWQLCPKVSGSRSTSTWLAGGTHVDYWNTSAGVSAALGVTASSSPRFAFVPSAELSYAITSARWQTARQGIEHEAQGSVRGGGLTIAPGLVFSQLLTLRPFVQVPVGNKGAKNIYGGSIAISFGSRKE
ncbi:MAG: hypothetical protein ACYC3F_08685 [Gemmatimonadaceae bacterium]